MKSRLLHLLFEIVLIGMVSWITINHLFGIIQIQDNSMYPKLMAGDLLVYSRLEKNYYVGDVVSVMVGKEEYILRVVAQGGDTVEFTEDGFFVLNGQTQYEEIMQKTVALENSDIEYPYQIPTGSYFLLGDARIDCADSRLFGAISGKQVNGKVIGCFRHRKF